MAMIPMVLDIRFNMAFSSFWVRMKVSFFAIFARTTSSSHTICCLSTAWFRNKMALKASSYVEAAIQRFTWKRSNGR
jgi:hypothetical protein